MSFRQAARKLRRDSGGFVACMASGTVLTVVYAWLTARGVGDATLEPGLSEFLLAGAGLSFLAGARIGLRGYRWAMGQTEEGAGR